MEIQELFLKHFGKFEEHRIPLKSGVNIIYGGNETGKSTLHSFIRAMLFGLSRGRGRASKQDEYQIRKPWENPAYFAGGMTIRAEGEVFRIDRNFDSRGAELSMVCTSGDYEIADPQEKITGLLGGISEAAFVNTVFISQAKCETGEALAEELRRCMVNGSSGQELQLDVTAALQTLRKKKKQAEQKKKKEEEVLEEKINKKQTEADYLRREIELFQQQLAASSDTRTRQYLEGGRNGRGERLEEWEAKDCEEEQEGLPGIGAAILRILLVLAGVLSLAAAVFLEGTAVRAAFGTLAVVFLLSLLPVHFLLLRHNGSEEDRGDGSGKNEEREAYFREEISKRRDRYQKLQEELETLYHSHVKMEAVETDIAALNLAIDRICELTVGIYEKTGGSMNRRASQILKEITEGRYERIVMDETGEIRIHTPERVLGLHQLSGGTLQQIYFAVRMAAGEVLCPEKNLPIVLDETFAMYDDARLEAVLLWLHRSGRQAIVFTCQHREREIMDRIIRSGR